jgi:PIN domain nuclease of toxin-antitoxin system
VATLIRKERLELVQDAAASRDELIRLGLREVELDGAVAAAAGAMTDLHGDPADRIITATALAQGCPLLTSDRAILAWPGPLERLDARR